MTWVQTLVAQLRVGKALKTSQNKIHASYLLVQFYLEGGTHLINPAAPRE